MPAGSGTTKPPENQQSAEREKKSTEIPYENTALKPAMNSHYQKRESSAQSRNLIRLQQLPFLIVLELLARKRCRVYPPNTPHSSATPTTCPVYLKEMLMGQVAAGIEFEDEDVIDSSLSPAIRVDTQEKEEFYQEKATSIDSHQRPHIWSIYKSHTWQRQK